MTSTGAISPDIFDPLSVYIASGYPAAGADLTVLNAQFLVGTSSDNADVRKKAVLTIADDLQRQAAIIGLVNTSLSYAVAKDVSGFNALPYGLWYSESVTKK